MGQMLNRWEGLTGRSGALRFVDINLRGIGQVMFQDHPLSGLLFLIAIGWGSYTAGTPQIAIGGLLAVVVATLTAQSLRVEEAGLRSGLFGYNAFLVGIALPTFLTVSPLLWVYIVIGAAVSVIAMRATANVMSTWGVSALTAPFVLVTWLLLLSVNAFTGIEGGALPASSLIVPIAPEASDPLRIGDFLSGILTSISQVFVKGDAPLALLILAGLAVSSWAAAGFALAAAVLSVVVAHLLGAESQLITGGLHGFNPVLTAIALGAVFYRPGLRVTLFALLGAVFTILAQGAMIAAMTPFAIPTLTASFVLVTWLFALARFHWD